MSIKDVIKSSVYESFGGGTELSAWGMLFILFTAGLVGLYLFMVYKLSAKTEFYSKDLNITIGGMPIVIAAIMVAMQSNLIVSLGMVGALSIVRFRNAVKNPLDLLYLFWSVSAGIICGVGLRGLTLALCIVMTAFILLLQLIPRSKAASILVLRSKEEDMDWAEIKETIRKYSRNCRQKSRSCHSGETEIIFELTVGKEEELMKALHQYPQLAEVNLLSYDGEYRI